MRLISQYMQGHSDTMMKITDIISKYISYVPIEMIKEMEEYHYAKDYEYSAMQDHHSEVVS
jgi:uncharacterized protein YsxB (DUF464 family)